MTIFAITYLADNLPIKAYLGIPAGVPFDRADVERTLIHRYGPKAPVSVEIVEEAEHDSASSRAGAGPFPGLVYCRGGINRVGMSKISWIQDFLRHNVVVMAPWYRGTLRSPGRDEFGGADVEDVNEATRLLQALPIVDPLAVSVLGFSRGSINATRTAVDVPGVRSLVLWGGVSDLAWTYEERVDLRRMLKRVVGGSPTKVPDAYRARSPVHYAPQIPCPVHIFHGTDDVQVPFRHGLKMYEALTALGKPVTFRKFEGLGHHLPPAVHEEAIREIVQAITAQGDLATPRHET
jgi:dipeptidyl aminopeptidase/acylaminoacyl peptidase